MKKFLTVCGAIVVFTFLSCNHRKSGQSFNYSEEKLVAVMSDLYVASEALKKVDPELKDSMSEVFKRQISEIHDVEMSKVEKDIANLTDHPELYVEWHKLVKDSLVAKEANINAMKYD